MGQNPKLIIRKQKLLHNMKTLVNAAHAQGVQIALVSKSFARIPPRLTVSIKAERICWLIHGLKT